MSTRKLTLEFKMEVLSQSGACEQDSFDMIPNKDPDIIVKRTVLITEDVSSSFS